MDAGDGLGHWLRLYLPGEVWTRGFVALAGLYEVYRPPATDTSRAMRNMNHMILAICMLSGTGQSRKHTFRDQGPVRIDQQIGQNRPKISTNRPKCRP